MFDANGQWIHHETYEEFDNGLSELIDLWSGSATQAVKASALARFKEDMDVAVLEWIDNKAKSKKYAAIGKELAEFEAVLSQDAAVQVSDNTTAAVPAKTKKKA